MGTLDGLRARKCWTSGHTSSEGRADLPAGDAEMFSDASLVPFVLAMESMDALRLGFSCLPQDDQGQQHESCHPCHEAKGCHLFCPLLEVV